MLPAKLILAAVNIWKKYLINVDALESILLNKNKDDILNASLPNLIKNIKAQDQRKFTQLEGALGSVFLNLDAYWRENFNEPLVHILNIPVKYRTRFFSPIKTAFDYFMQYHSDRFSFNENNYHLKNNNIAYLPMISLPNTYKDVSNVLEDFKDCSIINLRSLKIKERVNLAGKELSGDITI